MVDFIEHYSADGLTSQIEQTPPLSSIEVANPVESVVLQTPEKKFNNPKLELLIKCVSEGVITGVTRFDTKVDQEKLKNIINEFMPRIKKLHEETSGEDIGVPEKFDWEHEVKQAMGDAIGHLSRSTILPLSIIKDATRFASPGNTVLWEGSDESSFDPHDYVKQMTGRRYGYDGLIPTIPFPQNDQERDETITVRIGDESIKYHASHYKEIFDELGTILADEHVLHMSAVGIAANEFGHALDYALASRGISTYFRAHDLPGNNDIDIPEIGSHIHQEHFARGIEEVVISSYLSDNVGLSDVQIQEFFALHYSYDASAVEQVRDLLQQRHLQRESSFISARKILMVQKVIEEELYKMYGDSGIAYAPSIEKYLMYWDVPYSPNEIGYLVSNSRSS